MKKEEQQRYPYSADLFRFCKEALNIKHNFEVKVIDQHVGSILGFDPADCSHWKKGKKNIKSLQAIQAIADHLNVDSGFVSDIVSGKMNLQESVQEYRGFGPVTLSNRSVEELKRDYFRNPSRYVEEGRQVSFENFIETKREKSVEMTTQLLEKANVRSLPVMLPEIIAAIPNAQFETAELENEAMLVHTVLRDGKFVFQLSKTADMRPHTRFQLAKEIGRVMLYGEAGLQMNDDLFHVRTNIFASLLLIPSSLLQRFSVQMDHTRDISSQMSRAFWVSRLVVNERLKEYMAHGN